MEDGAFLARALRHVTRGTLPLAAAISLYEAERMPKAKFKQDVSFLNGIIWYLPDGPLADARDQAMRPELEGRRRKGGRRSSNLYGDPVCVARYVRAFHRSVPAGWAWVGAGGPSAFGAGSALASCCVFWPLRGVKVEVERTDAWTQRVRLRCRGPCG